MSEIDPAGLVCDRDGAEIVVTPTDTRLVRFVEWRQRSSAGTEVENTGERENRGAPHPGTGQPS